MYWKRLKCSLLRAFVENVLILRALPIFASIMLSANYEKSTLANYPCNWSTRFTFKCKRFHWANQSSFENMMGILFLARYIALKRAAFDERPMIYFLRGSATEDESRKSGNSETKVTAVSRKRRHGPEVMKKRKFLSPPARLARPYCR